MKLYTEEQVKEAFNMGSWNKYEFKYVIKSLTPIELPNDEEIDMKIEDSNYSLEFDAGFISGAKWMRDKILNK